MSDDASLVLVDTSAWLLVAHPKRGRAFAPTITALQAANRVAINWLVRVELLTGAQDDEDYKRLDDGLEGLVQLPLHDHIWRETGRLRFQLRRRGYILPLVDLAIASSAIVYNCKLLHLDRHFDLIAKHAPLSVYKLDTRRATR